MTLALAMIVRDEAERLADVLNDAQGFIDELVIVDTGSTDDTKQIALDHGATVHDFTWCDDFSAARNYAFELARSPWIMWLDADDRIPLDSQALFRRAIERLHVSQHDAYFAEYRIIGAGGAQLLAYPRERIVRNSARFRWAGRVHEAISVPGSSPTLSAWVEHHPDVDAPISDRNLRLLERMYYEGDHSPRTTFYLANELRDHAQTSAAIDMYRLRLEQHGWIEERAQAAYELGKLLIGRDNDAARAALAFSWSLRPARAEPLRQLAHIAKHSDEPAAADMLTAWADGLPLPHGLFVEPWAYSSS